MPPLALVVLQFLMAFSVMIHTEQVNKFFCQILFSWWPSGWSGVGYVPVVAVWLDYDTFILYAYPFYYGQLISECQVLSHVLIDFISSCGQPSMIYMLHLCKCSSITIISCKSCINMHVVMSIATLMASLSSFMPLISSSLFYVWLCLTTNPLCIDKVPFCRLCMFCTDSLATT